MTCDQAKEEIKHHVVGEVNAEGRLELEKHLAGCAACTGALNKASNLHYLIKTAFGSVPVSESPSKNILRAVQGRVEEAAKPTASVRIPRWPFAAACLIALVAAISLLNQPKQDQSFAGFIDPCRQHWLCLLNQLKQEQSLAEKIFGTVIIEQHRITTPADKSGTVKLYDQTSIELGQKTELIVAKGDSKRAVYMAEGTATFEVIKDAREFEVRTPMGQVKVIGTQFQVSLNGKNMNVIVFSGIVQVRNELGSVTAQKDEQVVVAQDEKPVKQVGKPIDQTKWPTCHKCTTMVRDYSHHFRHGLPCPNCLKKGGDRECECKEVPLKPTACNECAQKENICFICGKSLAQEADLTKLLCNKHKTPPTLDLTGSFKQGFRGWAHTFFKGKCVVDNSHGVRNPVEGTCQDEHQRLDISYCLDCAKTKSVCFVCGEMLDQEKTCPKAGKCERKYTIVKCNHKDGECKEVQCIVCKQWFLHGLKQCVERDSFYVCDKCAAKGGICPGCGLKVKQEPKLDYKQFLELHKKNELCPSALCKAKHEHPTGPCQVCKGDKIVLCINTTGKCESCAQKEMICNLCGKNLQEELEKQIQELLKKLDADDPTEREEATERLIELGKVARETVKKGVVDYLKKATDEYFKKLKDGKDDARLGEVISRCERILAGFSVEQGDLVVKSAEEQSGIVLIGGGLANNIKVHDRFIVLREGAFIAGLRAVVVYKSFSTCAIETVNKGFYPRQGDRLYKEDELGEHIQKLLNRLNADDAKEREKATEELVELGKLAKEMVKKPVEEHLKWANQVKKPEVEERCKRILEEIGIIITEEKGRALVKTCLEIEVPKISEIRFVQVKKVIQGNDLFWQFYVEYFVDSTKAGGWFRVNAHSGKVIDGGKHGFE